MTSDPIPLILTATALILLICALLIWGWRCLDALAIRQERERAEIEARYQARMAEIAAAERAWRLYSLSAQAADLEAKAKAARSERSARRYRAELRRVVNEQENVGGAV